MKKTLTRVIDAPFGKLTLAAEEDALIAIRFGGDEETQGCDASEILDCAAVQLEEYFSGARCAFSVPVRMYGTDFQKKVWQALTEIGWGETASYAEIAGKIGNPKACRAVGLANNKNPLPIIVPCHRVIGKNGALTGYAGGLDVKQWLLNHEKREN
ncbi:MAG: methylated-DNA--[Clostridia bacterium]|nr:methylated-DNA--[protein]-cysteine S-methyltransferase [Clostridia bacterium]